MFDTVNVPCVAVVENMAYYDTDPASQINNADELEQDVRAMLKEKGLIGGNGDDTDTDNVAEELVQLVLKNAKTDPIRIFGPGHKKRLSDQWGIEHTYSMPLMDKIAANGDSGTPFVLGNPDSPQTQIYKDLASSVVSEVAKAKFSSSRNRPEIEYIDEFNIIQVDDDALEPVALRRACRCAACVEELTGRQILKASDVPLTIKPARMSSTGNYALSVDWSDGHRSLYPYRQIRSLISPEKEEESKEKESKSEGSSEKTETTTSSGSDTNAVEEKTCSCC